MCSSRHLTETTDSKPNYGHKPIRSHSQRTDGGPHWRRQCNVHVISETVRWNRCQRKGTPAWIRSQIPMWMATCSPYLRLVRAHTPSQWKMRATHLWAMNLTSASHAVQSISPRARMCVCVSEYSASYSKLSRNQNEWQRIRCIICCIQTSDANAFYACVYQHLKLTSEFVLSAQFNLYFQSSRMKTI